MQLHAVVLAMFASIIAPFGGFFASGFKRGFKIKDFGDSIPGHGGMTDRMDCQAHPSSAAMIYAALACLPYALKSLTLHAYRILFKRGHSPGNGALSWKAAESGPFDLAMC